MYSYAQHAPAAAGFYLAHQQQNPLHHPPQHQHQYQAPVTASAAPLKPGDITLILRQQPKEALVTSEGKEKARKPVDPPPIIQLTVKQHTDPSQHFLQSPYLFMCASLHKFDKDQAIDEHASKCLAGSLVSSLHRLKDVDNKDGGFFVFGDISVKVQGTFRLHFSLFDLHKASAEVHFLASITSEPFKVVLPKDFKGLDESTYLSRAFSDQGVRLRLRKEPRAMMGNKRTYPYAAEQQHPASTPIRPSIHEYPYPEESFSPNKRFRPNTEETKRESYTDHNVITTASFPSNYSSSHYASRFRQETEDIKRDSYPDHTTVSNPSFTSTYTPSQYGVRQPSLSNNYSLPQFGNYGSLGTGNNTAFSFRATLPNYESPVLESTDNATTLQPRFGDIQSQNYPTL